MEPTNTQTGVAPKKTMLWVVIGVVVLIALYGVSSYNSFVNRNEKVNNTWAQIDTQLQRRYDLIPNLVSSVKGLTTQEQKVFGEIADARTRYAGASTPEDKAQAANQVESALGRLLVITENYPVLRSSEAFTSLMVQLEGTENRIAVARKDYNDSVTTLNTALKRFPGSAIGSLFGFHARTYFEITNDARQTPKVEFN